MIDKQPALPWLIGSGFVSLIMLVAMVARAQGQSLLPENTAIPWRDLAQYSAAGLAVAVMVVGLGWLAQRQHPAAPPVRAAREDAYFVQLGPRQIVRMTPAQMQDMLERVAPQAARADALLEDAAAVRLQLAQAERREAGTAHERDQARREKASAIAARDQAIREKEASTQEIVLLRNQAVAREQQVREIESQLEEARQVPEAPPWDSVWPTVVRIIERASEQGSIGMNSLANIAREEGAEVGRGPLTDGTWKAFTFTVRQALSPAPVDASVNARSQGEREREGEAHRVNARSVNGKRSTGKLPRARRGGVR